MLEMVMLMVGREKGGEGRESLERGRPKVGRETELNPVDQPRPSKLLKRTRGRVGQSDGIER